MARYVVFTADDFGAAEDANRAIASAHADGVLTSASIMVCEQAVCHAAALARDLPKLGVGLHLTLSDGLAALGHAEAPRLVGPNGRFRRNPARAGIAYWYRRGLRPAIRREIAAQFERSERLGINLDHADGHQHLHIHPVIWDALTEECALRGIRWIRLPVEEARSARRSVAALGRRLEQAAFCALAGRCRRIAAVQGLRVADRVIGHLDSGNMDERRILSALNGLGEGVSEVYSHPGANADELRALTGALVAERLRELEMTPVAFRDLP